MPINTLAVGGVIIYLINIFLGTLFTFLFFKYLSKTKDVTISSTAEFFAYREKTGLYYFFPNLIVIGTLFVSLYYKLFDSIFFWILYIFEIIFLIYLFLIFRKHIIELTSRIKGANQKVGNTVQFLWGYSSWSETLKLFFVILTGFILIILLAIVLIHFNII